jgi:hypothetical protein
LATYWARNTVHPFVSSYRNHPILTVVVVSYWAFLPVVFALVSERQTAFWHDAFFGEIVVGLALLIAWYRLRKPAPPKKGDRETDS